MTFESFSAAWHLFLIGGFVIALIMGAVVNKTNFCTMGAVSDWVNIGDPRRFRAWMLAISIALIGVVILEYGGLIRADNTFPPYRNGTLIWGENVLGGVLFGIGMTLASGCGNKTLVRLGGGNLKSVFVLAIIGLIAYFMINPFPGTDKTLFSTLFLPWTQHLRTDLGVSQDLGTLAAGVDNATTGRLLVGGLIGLALLIYVFKSKDFRKDGDNLLGGTVVGLAILAAWVLTSMIMVSADGEQFTLVNFYTDWDFLADEDALKPNVGAMLNAQSYTFINPIGQTLGYLKSGLAMPALTFGVVAVIGIILGSFIWSLITRRFRLEWFASVNDFIMHVIGAILMGFGGVLGMGCTIGQGITGVSTLALGSFFTLISIIVGSALTMKIQYYKMVYEQEATFSKALIASLADLRLLPNSVRQLDKV